MTFQRNHSFYLLMTVFMLLLSLHRPTGTITASSTENWTDFYLMNCSPDSKALFDNQESDQFKEAEDIVLKINISSLTNGKLRIDFYEDVTPDKRENTVETIENAGNYVFSHKVNDFHVLLEASDPFSLNSPVESSVQASYAVFSSEMNLIVDWTEFELFNCKPRYIKVFSGEGFVHNLTIKMNVNEVSDGTLDLVWYESDYGLVESFTNTSEKEFLISAAEVRIEFYAPNGSYAKGSYSIVDHGALYRQVPGLTLPLLILSLGVIISIKKLYSKHK